MDVHTSADGSDGHDATRSPWIIQRVIGLDMRALKVPPLMEFGARLSKRGSPPFGKGSRPYLDTGCAHTLHPRQTPVATRTLGCYDRRHRQAAWVGTAPARCVRLGQSHRRVRPAGFKLGAHEPEHASHFATGFIY